METTAFDLIVIGGGSGGMSCAKQAASLGANVVLFDFVKPSSMGTSWGLGGTCVNVGCVPKKLCHFAGLLGHSFHDAQAMGWKVAVDSHSWEGLVENVSSHIQMLNFRYRVMLKSKAVNYINALATFVDAHTVTYTLPGKKGGVRFATAPHIVIAVGGRPLIPEDIVGAREFAITSDDVFSLEKAPGKTLCVGGSYISLECAGFLSALRYDVTVAARSILLRGFDRQCSEFIGSLMSDMGTKILQNTVPLSIRKLPDGKLEVSMLSNGEERVDMFDTVLMATGRAADVAGLNLTAAGVTLAANGKIPVDCERTNVAGIYAIGDVCQGLQELTPVAIKAGELLAKRLFGGSTVQMDYSLVPTTVFTPVEYGSVGISEEEAISRYGSENIDVYLSQFTTLELSAVHRTKHADGEDMGHCCLSKLICLKTENERVVGFHFVGPNAGEITQGFALAVKMGATKADFDSVISIHPTDAESFCSMQITRRSGIDFAAAGGCGGGVCG